MTFASIFPGLISQCHPREAHDSRLRRRPRRAHTAPRCVIDGHRTPEMMSEKSKSDRCDLSMLLPRHPLLFNKPFVQTFLHHPLTTPSPSFLPPFPSPKIELHRAPNSISRTKHAGSWDRAVRGWPACRAVPGVLDIGFRAGNEFRIIELRGLRPQFLLFPLRKPAESLSEIE
ncbi:hypothetical protein RRG08_002940 [Elysia crispata]|uniref:Uncharacterized protein n=1 Tax=Elysia crispata TaxID=231223 RepID=A0AAE1APE9_9GAST|nr:hypothetical protein RRG08_002940 [Elysia crispata]